MIAHASFHVGDIDKAKEFYKAALAAGGTDNGAPGYRTEYGAGYYAAFVHDPSGHNIEAMYWNANKQVA